MKLEDIKPAVTAMNNNPVVLNLRGHTYLSTYPDMISYLHGVDEIKGTQLRQLSLMVYGWMPRVLRLHQGSFQLALKAANAALDAKIDNYQNTQIQHIANYLHSVVGASKLLHFINPAVFPIWDSKIQAFRGLKNNYGAMSKIENYLSYTNEVHAINADTGFNDFYNQYCEAHANRLNQSDIEMYKVGHIRAIEASAFELAQ